MNKKRTFRLVAAAPILFLAACSRHTVLVSDVLLDARYMGQPSPPLAQGTKLAQVFVAPHDGLTKVEMFVATYTKTIPTGTLQFSLLEGAGGPRVVATGSMPLAQVKDNSFIPFEFPPISDSGRKTYTLQLSSSDLPSGYPLSAWLSKADIYPDGKFLVNGNPVTGSAALTAFSNFNKQ
jgi:hypothetical protein